MSEYVIDYLLIPEYVTYVNQCNQSDINSYIVIVSIYTYGRMGLEL